MTPMMTRLRGRRTGRLFGWAARVRWFVCAATVSALMSGFAQGDEAKPADSQRRFRRIATFVVCENGKAEEPAVAEIVTASRDGNLLIYTDGVGKNIGFVDISNAAQPRADGVVAVGGEPTSVAVAGRYALAAVNTSKSFSRPNGVLRVIDLGSRRTVRTIELGGQPDSICVSPDERYACIAIENERDESAGDRRPPQSPPGWVTVVDLQDDVADWKLRKVPLVGIADRFPYDPEPEYVDINDQNVAVVTLQENNHLVLIDLARAEIVADWSAGTVNLSNVDTKSDGLIQLDGELTNVPREPDAVAWVCVGARAVVTVPIDGVDHALVVDMDKRQVVTEWLAGTLNPKYEAATGIASYHAAETEGDGNGVFNTNSPNGAGKKSDKGNTTIKGATKKRDARADVATSDPDSVTWITRPIIVTADEGDLDGGTRGFTIFDDGRFRDGGQVLFTCGNTLENLLVRIGHYPEKRSNKRGNEPEAVACGRFGEMTYLFVGSERSSVVTVYLLDASGRPELLQVLPAGVGPEGLKALPKRNLLVAASEVDARDDHIRSSITIYRLDAAADEEPSYPTILSADDRRGQPIAWGALSALAADPGTKTVAGAEAVPAARDNEWLPTPKKLYAAHDGKFRQSRIFQIDATDSPAVITAEIVLRDESDLLAGIDKRLIDDPTTKRVNLNITGLAVRPSGDFWVASAGKGTVGDADKPFEAENLLCKVAKDGNVVQVIRLPAELTAVQSRFGLSGIASSDQQGEEVLYVCFQRPWREAGDPDDRTRIGRYDCKSKAWTFAYYPLDEPTSSNGGWVGLSELIAIGGGRFAVIERDNQAGPDARVKQLASFSIDDVEFRPHNRTVDFQTVRKSIVRNLVGDLKRSGGLVLEKVDGLAILPGGDACIVTNNAGVDNTNGETQLIELGKVFAEP